MTIELPEHQQALLVSKARAKGMSPEDYAKHLLEHELSLPAVFEEGLGLFGSPEDAALLDEVVTMAYEERRRPGKRTPSL
jgi:hypothetical protein